MSSTFRIVVNTSDNANDTSGLVPVALTAPELYLRKIQKYFLRIMNGSAWAGVTVTNNAVAATGSITFSSFVQNDTVTVNGTLFTGKDSPSTSVQFKTGVSDASTAASLATVLNAHATVGKQVIAAQDGTTAEKVDISCSVPGQVGNLCTLAISAHGTRSGANFTGGTEGTSGTAHQGK